MQKERVISKLERKSNVKRKGAALVHEEVAVRAKLERYDNRTEQYRQNRLFESNQKKQIGTNTKKNCDTRCRAEMRFLE